MGAGERGVRLAGAKRVVQELWGETWERTDADLSDQGERRSNICSAQIMIVGPAFPHPPPFPYRYHEIRNPLNGTVGWLREMQHAEELSNEKLIAMADRAMRSTEVALRFLDSLSIMFKLEARSVEISLAPCNLRGVLEDAKVLMTAQTCGVPLILDVSPGVAELYTFMCDSSLLLHILLNLCQHASQSIQSGSITIECRDHPLPLPIPSPPSEPEKRLVRFTIKITGNRFTPATSRHLFSRNSTESDLVIGLSFSQQLALVLGGQLKAVPALNANGMGDTCFELTLPLEARVREVVAQPSPLHQDPTAMAESSDSCSVAVTLQQQGRSFLPPLPPTASNLPRDIRVLLAGHSETSQRILSNTFEGFQWSVRQAETIDEVCPL